VGTLEGRGAIVTGGGQGVGLGIALALAAEGANVVVCGRNEAPLEEAVVRIAERGGHGLAHVCDVSHLAELEALVARTVDVFGRIDILVNNVALVPLGTILDIDEALVEAAWIAGPLASMRLMRLCFPYLRQGKGAVINVSSGAAIASETPMRGIYAAVKAALNAISRAAANEWGPDGVRVNTIMPFAYSDSVARYFETEPEEANAAVARVPLRRLGDPEEDIGRAVAFLAGPAAQYITGVTLPIDGGMAYLR
jgi:meso-butanediol dehydrogenase / (S,S)-butanediol dehydrogenase / diacetyl reductase